MRSQLCQPILNSSETGIGICFSVRRISLKEKDAVNIREKTILEKANESADKTTLICFKTDSWGDIRFWFNAIAGIPNCTRS